MGFIGDARYMSSVMLGIEILPTGTAGTKGDDMLIERQRNIGQSGVAQ